MASSMISTTYKLLQDHHKKIAEYIQLIETYDEEFADRIGT